MFVPHALQRLVGKKAKETTLPGRKKKKVVGKRAGWKEGNPCRRLQHPPRNSIEKSSFQQGNNVGGDGPSTKKGDIRGGKIERPGGDYADIIVTPAASEPKRDSGALKRQLVISQNVLKGGGKNWVVNPSDRSEKGSSADFTYYA